MPQLTLVGEDGIMAGFSIGVRSDAKDPNATFVTVTVFNKRREHVAGRQHHLHGHEVEHIGEVAKACALAYLYGETPTDVIDAAGEAVAEAVDTVRRQSRAGRL